MGQGRFVFVVIAAFLAGMLGAYALGALKPAASDSPIQESVYQRVMRTQTIRCGYVVDPPHVMKDANTGAMSGAIVDILNEAGKLLALKIDWTEEVGWGNTVEALKSGRIDAICTDFWMEPLEGKYVGYTMPLYYAGVGIYVRADDHRFDNNLAAISDPAITVSTTDGEMNGVIAQEDFPKAKILSMPNMTDVTQNLINVATGKADVTFPDTMMGWRFEQSNPGKLKNLVPDHPVRAFPATIALPQGDLALKTTLDSAFVQLLYGGFVVKTLEKYHMPADAVYRVARPYDVPGANSPPR